jgi:hypothetical protein
MVELGIPAKERDQAQGVLILTYSLLSPASRASYPPAESSDANCGHLLVGIERHDLKQIAELLKEQGWHTLDRLGRVDPQQVEAAFKKKNVYYPMALRAFQVEYYKLLGVELDGILRATRKKRD